MHTSGRTLDKNVFYKSNMDITPFLSLQQKQPKKYKNFNRLARFLIVGNLLILRRSTQKRMQSKSKFLTKAMQNSWISPKKSLYCLKMIQKHWHLLFLHKLNGYL